MGSGGPPRRPGRGNAGAPLTAHAIARALAAEPGLGVVAFDRDLVVTAVAGGALARAGFRRLRDAVGRPISTVLPRRWEPTLAPLLASVGEGRDASVVVTTGEDARFHVEVTPDTAGDGVLTVRAALPEADGDAVRQAFEHAPVGLGLLSIDGRWLHANATLARLLQRTPAELAHETVESLTHPEEVAHDLQLLDQVRRGKAATCQLETRFLRPDGQVVHVQVAISLARAEDGTPLHFVAQVQDNTERRLAAARLEHLALHDPLTGLPNRALLVEQLRHALLRLERSGRALAVLFLDLDRFKNVNDSLGHPVGDQLLGQVASRVRAAIRPGDVVGRLGGDEFVVICEELGDPNAGALVAERIAEALRAPFHLGGHEVFVTASVGIALARAGDDAADLLRDADAAMYRAKARGRDRHEYFHDALRRGAVERLELEAGLRRAMDEGQLVLHYQPQVRVADGVVAGVEALVRWQHPDRGMVLPGSFLPVAEDSRLILPLGRWVLEEACRQAAEWSGLQPELRVAVNVSAHQLTGSEFVDSVAAALDRHRLAPDRLCLEITEGAFVGAVEFAGRTLATLADLGIDLAVDDFGTGYATFDFVRRVPLRTIKIAGEFMRGMERDRRDAGIVASILTLARALELTAVAEGVETPPQHDYLRRAGCQLAQGFAYARPAPPEAVTALLRAGTRLRASAAEQTGD